MEASGSEWKQMEANGSAPIKATQWKRPSRGDRDDRTLSTRPSIRERLTRRPDRSIGALNGGHCEHDGGTISLSAGTFRFSFI